MKSGIGIVGFTSPDEKTMVAEIWESIQGEQENPNSSLWFIELAGDDGVSSRKFLGVAHFEKGAKEILSRLKEFYEPLTKFSLEAVIPKRLICDGQGELDIGLARYYLGASAKLLRESNIK